MSVSGTNVVLNWANINDFELEHINIFSFEVDFNKHENIFKEKCIASDSQNLVITTAQT